VTRGPFDNLTRLSRLIWSSWNALDRLARSGTRRRGRPPLEDIGQLSQVHGLGEIVHAFAQASIAVGWHGVGSERDDRHVRTIRSTDATRHLLLGMMDRA
jgi:hypothetical protein